MQKRLSIYNLNPGPLRRKEGAIEKRIAGRWHITTPREASEYFEHVLLTSQFHVTHYAGFAILYKKETSCLHDTRWDLPIQVMEGGQRWVMQGVLSLASFRRTPPHGREGYDRVKVAYFHYRQKTRYFEEAHLHNPCLFLFVMSLTWFQVISIEQHGDVTEALEASPMKIL